MWGGEIYYRAIGRPWGPAADFIVTVHPLTGIALAARAARERSESLAHSSLSRAGRLGEFSIRMIRGGPPARAVWTV